MGVPFVGGTVVTRGGLIFMGGTLDRHMRALDLETGEELWSDTLPNSAQATPMSYMSPKTQRQYVVIAVPAIEQPKESHAVGPEAKRSRVDVAQARAAESSGGWIIAYALPTN
jgi:glucose dehydrogenase